MKVNDRKYQLGWFEDGSVIRQDQDLLDYIQTNGFKSVKIKGDIFLKEQIGDGQLPFDLCVYMVTQPFRFDELINDINQIMRDEMDQRGIMYLAINKYLATADNYDNDLSDDYTDAILEYVSENVNAEIIEYHRHLKDDGTGFNWVHPLTIFYLRKNDN